MDYKELIVTVTTVVLLLILYYLTIMPKKKQEKEIKKMQDELKKGDKVITYSGLSGIIDEVLDDRIILSTRPDDVKMSVEKWAIAGLDDREEQKEKP